MLHCPRCRSDLERQWKNGPVKCKCGLLRQDGKFTIEAQVTVVHKVRRDVTADLMTLKAKILASGRQWGPEMEKAGRTFFKEEELVEDRLTLRVIHGRLYRYRGFDITKQEQVPEDEREAAFHEFMCHVRLQDVVDVLTD